MRFIGAGARPGRPQIDHDRVFTVPNALTVLRFMGVPLFIWLVLAQKEYGFAVVVLAVMAGTDWMDGYVARRFDQASKLGRVMDPLADRLALIAVAVTLVIAGVVHWLYLAALLVPDAVLLALTLFYFRGHPDLPVSRVGKVRTGLLLLGTPLLVLSRLDIPRSPGACSWRPGSSWASASSATGLPPTTTSGPFCERAECRRPTTAGTA